MNRRTFPLVCVALLVLATLAACGTPKPQAITPEADRVATRVVEELAVAATLTALAPASPSATPTRRPSTAVASPTPTRLPVTVVPLPTPTRLPVTVVPLPTPTRLPATSVPPTATRPRATLTPTRIPSVQATSTALKVAVLPVDGSDGNPNLHNGRSVNAGRNVLLPGVSQSTVKSPMIFGDSVVFQVEVFDETVGKRDGDGIASVTFTIKDESGKAVHEYIDTAAPYCVFDGKSDCTVWQFSKQSSRWPGSATLRYGVHDVQITIKPKKGEAVNWSWSFKIEKQ